MDSTNNLVSLPYSYQRALLLYAEAYAAKPQYSATSAYSSAPPPGYNGCQPLPGRQAAVTYRKS